MMDSEYKAAAILSVLPRAPVMVGRSSTDTRVLSVAASSSASSCSTSGSRSCSSPSSSTRSRTCGPRRGAVRLAQTCECIFLSFSRVPHARDLTRPALPAHRHADPASSSAAAAATSAPKPSRMLKIYEKTHFFWVVLVVASLSVQATITVGASDGHLRLISASASRSPFLLSRRPALTVHSDPPPIKTISTSPSRSRSASRSSSASLRPAPTSPRSSAARATGSTSRSRSSP